MSYKKWSFLLKEPKKNIWKNILGNGRNGREPPKKRRRFQGYKEDPFLFFEDGDEAFNEVKDYFKLKEVGVQFNSVFAKILIIRVRRKIGNWKCGRLKEDGEREKEKKVCVERGIVRARRMK